MSLEPKTKKYAKRNALVALPVLIFYVSLDQDVSMTRNNAQQSVVNQI